MKICFKSANIRCSFCDAPAVIMCQPKAFYPSVRLCKDCAKEVARAIKGTKIK